MAKYSGKSKLYGPKNPSIKDDPYINREIKRRADDIMIKRGGLRSGEDARMIVGGAWDVAKNEVMNGKMRKKDK